jgi:hypothetical protein
MKYIMRYHNRKRERSNCQQNPPDMGHILHLRSFLILEEGKNGTNTTKDGRSSPIDFPIGYAGAHYIAEGSANKPPKPFTRQDAFTPGLERTLCAAMMTQYPSPVAVAPPKAGPSKHYHDCGFGRSWWCGRTGR